MLDKKGDCESAMCRGRLLLVGVLGGFYELLNPVKRWAKARISKRLGRWLSEYSVLSTKQQMLDYSGWCIS